MRHPQSVVARLDHTRTGDKKRRVIATEREVVSDLNRAGTHCRALYSPRYTRHVANDLFDALMQFHREVVQPQFDEIRLKISDLPSKADLNAMREEMATKAELQAIRDQMATKADLQGVEQRVEAEFQAIRVEMATKSDLRVVEQSVGSLEQSVGGVEQSVGGVEQSVRIVEQSVQALNRSVHA